MIRGIVGLLSCGFVPAFATVAIDRRVTIAIDQYKENEFLRRGDVDFGAVFRADFKPRVSASVRQYCSAP